MIMNYEHAAIASKNSHQNDGGPWFIPMWIKWSQILCTSHFSGIRPIPSAIIGILL